MSESLTNGVDASVGKDRSMSHNPCDPSSMGNIGVVRDSSDGRSESL